MKYVFCVESDGAPRSLFVFHYTDQAAGREQLDPGSAAWNTYSVTFFSRCTEVEI